MSNNVYLTPEKHTHFFFAGSRIYQSLKKAQQHAYGKTIGRKLVEREWGGGATWVTGKPDIWKVTLSWEKVQEGDPQPENWRENIIE